MINPKVDAPFKKGDKVLAQVFGVTEAGVVKEVWRIDRTWLIMVTHGNFAIAYSPEEVSLIPQDTGVVVYVNFQTKKRI